MKKPTEDTSQKVFLGSLLLLIIFVLIFSSYLIGQRNKRQSSAAQAEKVLTLQSSRLSNNSSYFDKRNAVFFNLTSGDLNGSLYEVKSDKEQDILAFLAEDPQYDSGLGDIASLIPDEPHNIRMVAVNNDNSETYLLDSNHQLDAAHYYFEQTRCGNIPVYASNVQVHIGSDNNVYALSGTLMKGDVDCTQNLNESQADSIALAAFMKEFKLGAHTEKDVSIRKSQQYILSLELIDKEPASVHVTRYVDICFGPGSCNAYFVEMKQGNIVHSTPTSAEAVNRKVTLGGANCQNPPSPVSTVRTESDGPSGNEKVDKTFDILGETYNFYFNNFNRDSMNGAGGLISTTLPSCNNNACWTGAELNICSGLVAKDVIAHEFQHGVTQYAAGIGYEKEPGALNESLSDIFAMGIDTANWTMGEGTSLGSIRDFSNPSRFGHPSRLFATIAKDGSAYVCTPGDHGGVHSNSGVFNHAFYLMVEGGSFNGCTITGIGKTNMVKVHHAMYRALTIYLKGKTTANYKDMYDALVQACNDLYKPGSLECDAMITAMQATEMDQQISGNSQGPACIGLTEKPATCVGSGGGGPQPTGSTTPAITSAASPTPGASVTPTGPQAPSKKLPLLSSVSQPKLTTGDVEFTYDGTIYKLSAALSEASFNSFFVVNDSGSLRPGFQAGVPIRGELVGSDKIDTGSFSFERGAYVNRYSSGKDLSQYTAYQVLAINDKGEEVPFLLADLSSFIGAENKGDTGSTGGETPVNTVSLTISLRLQGVDKKPKSTEAILVKVGIGSDELTETIYKSTVFIPGEGGLWTGKVDFDIPEGSEYKVLIKGPKHIQRKICENNPKEEQPGLYKCNINKIQLQKGNNTLDFSGVIMLVGDLPINQDGIVNSRDVLLIRDRLNKTDFESLVIGDVNYDGTINAIDDALTIFTLTNRTDQN